jgi:signal transduction histidine kinase
MSIPDPQSTVQKSGEAARARVQEQVQELLNQRAALARLEQAAAIREKTSRVAHDVRNPLATIQSICSSLIIETECTDQRKRLQLISGQVDRLASLLSQAVEGTKEGDDAPRPIDMEELALSLTNLLSYQTSHQIRFDVRVKAAQGSRLPQRALTRSLYHVLRNAAEAMRGHHGGRVLLECRKTGRGLEIKVTDNGPGLPRELLERGLRSYTATEPGRALGLASVERFARSLGGELVLGDAEPTGAQILIRVPVDWVEPAGTSH